MYNRRIFLNKAIYGAAAAALLPSLSFKSDDYDRLLILHTNDLHCHVEPFPDTDPRYGGKGGMNRISAYVKQMRKSEPELLFFDSGDFSQGTPYYNFFKGEVVLKLMSEMGYDASTIGNHDFDSGLTQLFKSLEFANFPIVSSNYDFSRTDHQDKIKKNLILVRKGLRIGVYGLGIELDGLVGKKLYEETIYKHPIETALEQEDYLKNEMRCDIVICLSHLGFNYTQLQICDIELAKSTSFTDLILGGHTHTFLDAPIERENKQGMPVVINQVGYAALMLGRLELFIEKRGKKFYQKSKNQRIG